MKEPTEIAQVIQVIADKLGVASEHLWGILVRQAPISSSVDLVFIAAFTAMFVWAARKLKASKHDIVPVGWLVWGGLVFIIALAVAEGMPRVIAGFVNPEYWALTEILNKVNP